MPPYRTLAKRAGYSASTLSIAASGTALPSLDVTLAYVQACGGDPEPWRERRQKLAAQQVRRDATARPVDRDEYAPVRPNDEVGGTQHAARATVVGPTPVPLPVPKPRRSKFSRRRRSPFLIAGTGLVVLLVGLGLAAAVINRPVTPDRTGSADSISHLQIANLYNVISWQQSMHIDSDAAADLAASRDQHGERDALLEAAQVRMQQAEQVEKLDVTKVPDGPHMVELLHDFWINRAAADSLYAAFANNHGPNELASSTARTALKDVESDAQQAGNAATFLWNLHAQAMGMPLISERTL